MSFSPGPRTSSRLLRRTPTSSPTRPVATSAAAMPASVASKRSGKALFVPVDSVASGTSPQPRATARCVPSPPSTAMALMPRSAISAAASVLSRALSVSAISSSRTLGMLGWRSRACCARDCTSRARPEVSGISQASWMPSAPAEDSSRSTALIFSVVEKVLPQENSRRRSRPEEGLAMMPRQAAGVGFMVCRPLCGMVRGGTQACFSTQEQCQLHVCRRRSRRLSWPV